MKHNGWNPHFASFVNFLLFFLFLPVSSPVSCGDLEISKNFFDKVRSDSQYRLNSAKIEKNKPRVREMGCNINYLFAIKTQFS